MGHICYLTKPALGWKNDDGTDAIVPTVIHGTNLSITFDQMKTPRLRESIILESGSVNGGGVAILELKMTPTYQPEAGRDVFVFVGGLNANGVTVTSAQVDFYNTASNIYHTETITINQGQTSLTEFISIAPFDPPAGDVWKIIITFYTTAISAHVTIGGAFVGTAIPIEIDSDYQFTQNDNGTISTSYFGDVFTSKGGRPTIGSYSIRLLPEADFWQGLQQILSAAGNTTPIGVFTGGQFAQEKSIFGLVQNQTSFVHYGGFYDGQIVVKSLI